MDVPWYEVTKNGNKQRLLKLVEESPNTLESVTLLNETALHIALRYGQLDIAEELAGRYPDLVEKLNTKGDTPLHLALLAGHATFLVWWLSHIPGSVLENGNKFINKVDKSLLFLAVETGSPEAVEALLKSPLGKESGGPNKLTALHAAVFQHRHPDLKTQAKEIIRALLDKQPELGREKDDMGKTPLHHAVTSGKYDLVDLLLRFDISVAIILNNEGESPVHLAAKLGHVRVFKLFMELCPESGFVTTKSGSNVLHLSIRAGERDMVAYILLRPELKILTKEKDEDGNTPGHLLGLFPDEIIRALLQNTNNFNKYAWNNEGLTEGDIHKARRQLQRLGLSNATDLNSTVVSSIARMKYMTNTNGQGGAERDKALKDSANNLLVVATLIAAVTFAAAFTFPGGYNDDEPDEGMETLATYTALQVFVVFDTLSMCASILAVLLLVWATPRSDLSRMPLIIESAMDFIAFAILSMLMAFAMGIYVVVDSQCRPLAIAVLTFVCIVYVTMVQSGVTAGGWQGTRRIAGLFTLQHPERFPILGPCLIKCTTRRLQQRVREAH